MSILATSLDQYSKLVGYWKFGIKRLPQTPECPIFWQRPLEQSSDQIKAASSLVSQSIGLTVLNQMINILYYHKPQWVCFINQFHMKLCSNENSCQILSVLWLTSTLGSVQIKLITSFVPYKECSKLKSTLLWFCGLNSFTSSQSQLKTEGLCDITLSSKELKEQCTEKMDSWSQYIMGIAHWLREHTPRQYCRVHAHFVVI